VPDFEGGENLSGKLSHGKNMSDNIRYIGPLSRFDNKSYIAGSETYDIVVLLSGPEPQRTAFEKKCLDLLAVIDAS
jgi:hypothetical protein